jgi:sulfite oxidase
MMAAGGSVDPFWMIYGAHRKADVLNLLEEHRIGTFFEIMPCVSLLNSNSTGNLSEEDSKVAVKDMTDPYANDPRRHPALQPRSMKPYNAETPLKLLADNFLTPK